MHEERAMRGSQHMAREACETSVVALDSDRVVGPVTEVVREKYGSGARVGRLDVTQLVGRVARCTVGVDDERGRTIEWVLVVKQYPAPGRAIRTHAVMQKLYESGFSRDAADRIRIPQPLGYVDGVGILMEEAGGTPLRALVKDMTATPEDVGRLGRAAAKLHTTPLDVGRPLDASSRLRADERRRETLDGACPALSVSLGEVLARARLASATPADGVALIHGDFHLGQVHVDGDVTWLLDLDNVRAGDPAADVASVFVFFKRTARKARRAAYVDTVARAFISEYFSQMSCAVAKRVPAYEALRHVERACKCARAQDEGGWESKIPLLIGQAEACVDAMDRLPARELCLEDVFDIYASCPGVV
jgi:hypothetical protein